MLSKTSKILLGVYAFLLVVILLTFSDDFGSFLLLGTGLFTLITLIFVVNDIKKLKNSLASRILSVVLISLVLYSTIMLFYGLGNIGIGSKGFTFLFTLLSYLIFLGLSIIIGVVLVIMNKNQNVQNNPNKILSIILLVVLILLFYSTTVSGMARLTNSPEFCTMHIEIKKNSFIFREGSKDYCLTQIAIKENNPKICESNRCVESVAVRNQDLSVCNYAEEYSNCIVRVTIRLIEKPVQLTPDICNVLNKKEAKDDCLKRFAFELNNKDFCLNVDDFLNCYAMLSDIKKNGDESQCNVLLSSSAREQCKRYVHSGTMSAINE